MPIPLSCPFCNSAFTLGTMPVDRRANCPRCGDAFPIRGEFASEDFAGPPVATPAPSAPPQSKRWFTLPRLLVLSIALAGVGVLAGQWFRKSDVPKPETTSSGTVAPAEFLGLKYLRSETDIVLGIQPAAILAYAERTQRDPRQLLAEAGIPGTVLDVLTKTGLTLDQIDHLVGGLTVGNETLEVRITLAFILRSPIVDEDKFLKTLEARRTTVGSRTLHQVNLGPLPGVMAWKAKPNVWIFTNRSEDLTPADGGSGPTSPTLRDLLTNHLAPSTAAWVVVNESDWVRKPIVKVAAQALKKENLLAIVEKLRALTIGWNLEDPPRLHVFVRLTDALTASKLREAFRDQAAGGASDWVQIDLPADRPEAIGKIGKILEDTLRP